MNVRKNLILNSLLVLNIVGIAPSIADEVKVSDSQGVSITIYNQNFGLIRDTRNINLSEGLNKVRFEDVASHIDPTSVSFQSISAPNTVVVREQNYQYDLMDPNTILSKSVGKELKFKQFLANGSVAELNGTLLNSPSSVVNDGSGYAANKYVGLVLKTSDGIVMNPHGQIHIAELPSGLVSKPSLLWKLESNKAGEHKTEIAYQTANINWNCDYVAVLAKDDDLIDLTSWVTINNKSGANYKNAALKLLAGDVHRVQPNFMGGRADGMMMAERAMAAAPQFREQAFAEYHLYSLNGKTDVNNNETKQLSLFNAASIPVKKLYIFEPHPFTYGYYSGGDVPEKKIQVKFEIANSEKNHLGMPMPKGKVRVYKKDADATLQFVGEDQIDHTPRDEKIRLYTGDAFDIVGERKQTNYRDMPIANGRVLQRYTYEISLRNHKDSEVTITTVEHAWGNWTILNSSQAYNKKDSQTFEFNTKVPANGESKITYEIEVR